MSNDNLTKGSGGKEHGCCVPDRSNLHKLKTIEAIYGVRSQNSRCTCEGSNIDWAGQLCSIS